MLAISAAPAYAASESVVRPFGGAGGRDPSGGLIRVGNAFYGVATFGGSNACSRGCGLVFRVNPEGSFKVLHLFGGGTGDGARPEGTLTAVDGVLYGATSSGGADNDGVVFALGLDGSSYHVLHSLTGADGASPAGSLAVLDGTLYGTTISGGSTGDGVLFSITTTGIYSVLHTFSGGTDGSEPYGGVTAWNNMLYGTTYSGGNQGDGVIWSSTPSGAETVLAPLTPSLGTASITALTVFEGRLYGTTTGGGVADDGTVFSLKPGGAPTVVHSFTGSPDGADSWGTPHVMGGILYGTTVAGGSDSNYCQPFGGCGVAWSLTGGGTYNVVYAFAGQPDAQLVSGALADLQGSLYGSSGEGGGSQKLYGSGTVFSITP